MIMEELDFMTDTSHGPEVLMVLNPNYSGKKHLAIEVFDEKTGKKLGHRTLCKDVRHKGTKLLKKAKLSRIDCKHCLRKYNSGDYMNGKSTV
jgi:hypothetical protein